MKKNFRNMNRFMTAAMAASLVLCSPLQAMAEETEAAQTEAAPVEVVSIGEKTGDSDYELSVVNETGEDINEIALRVSYGDFTDNLLADGTVLADKGTGTLWCTPGEIVNYVPPVYDLQLTFADDSTAVLHTLPFGDAEEITVVKDEKTGVVYTKFFSISMNSETDSAYRENSIAESGEATLKADYEAKLTAVASSGYSDGGSPSSSSSSGGGKKKKKNNDEKCLDDGLLF